jgi:hypothetical protein
MSQEERSIFWEDIVSVILNESFRNTAHVYIEYTCAVFRKVSEIELSLYSSKIFDKIEILLTICNTGIYCSSDKVGAVYLVLYIIDSSVVNISALCTSCEDMEYYSSVQCTVKPFGIGHVHIHFLLRMTDNMTSQNNDISSWDSLWICASLDSSGSNWDLITSDVSAIANWKGRGRGDRRKVRRHSVKVVSVQNEIRTEHLLNINHKRYCLSHLFRWALCQLQFTTECLWIDDCIGEFEAVGQEASVSCFNVFSFIRLEGLRRIRETVVQNIRCTCRDSNPLPPECSLLVQASPLKPSCPRRPVSHTVSIFVTLT